MHLHALAPTARANFKLSEDGSVSKKLVKFLLGSSQHEQSIVVVKH